MISKLQFNLRAPLGSKVQKLTDTVAGELQVLTMQDTLTIFGAAGRMHIQRECNELANKCNRTGARRGSVLISTIDKTKHSIKARHRR